MNRIGITIGDPAGLGPELILKISDHFKDRNAYVVYGELKIIEEAEKLLRKELKAERVKSVRDVNFPGVYVVDLNICEVSKPQPSITSGKVAVAYLARAVADAIYGGLDGLLTMPLNKFWARKVGFSYEGQTEYLAQAARTKDYAMMMYSERIRVVLLTTHIPLREVPDKVKKENIVAKLELIDREYRRLFKKKPTVGVLGLNPHAGEHGEIGSEDVNEILPAVEEAKRKGLEVVGPVVPDTAFLKEDLYDVILCMYHDQGLIPFKMLAFKEGVNLTLGLPFPRTSPAHGTAYDIAWRGVADPTPSLRALELLERMIQNLKR